MTITSKQTSAAPQPQDVRGGLSRRMVLGLAGAAGAAAPFGVFGAAQALTGFSAAALPDNTSEFPVCRPAATAAAGGALRPFKLAWNATAVCTSSTPVAKEHGIFAQHGLDVEFVNFGGSTEQLLEAIATGKADGGIGMALRWLKPLEQGFDVRITTGIHGGCLRLLGAKSLRIDSLASLRGKAIAVSDQASPAKNFFSILLAKAGIDPVKDVEWRQYPADLLALAVEKGEAQALADADPLTWLWLKDGKLSEVATNLTGEYADRSCCVLAVRGSLIRDDRAAATAATRAVREAGNHVAHDPEDSAAIFSRYGGKGSVQDLAAMLRSHTHHHQVIGGDLKKEIALYADELKLVKVIRPATDTAKFADRVYADVLNDRA
jgi:NitT/TauT family transport system substrate-binding protein